MTIPKNKLLNYNPDSSNSGHNMRAESSRISFANTQSPINNEKVNKKFLDFQSEKQNGRSGQADVDDMASDLINEKENMSAQKSIRVPPSSSDKQKEEEERLSDHHVPI